MTKIPWTEFSWNPIIGCTKVSPGCENCYAEKMAARMPAMLSQTGTGDSLDTWRAYSDVTNQERAWSGKTAFIQSALEKPIKRKKPTMYFVCSMGDILHPTVHQSWLHEILNVIRITPQHTYQILTKRPERFFEYDWQCSKYGWDFTNALPQNLWFGVTAENQEMADKRIPMLFHIPAAVRFLSVEPMLEEIALWPYLVCRGCGTRKRKNLSPGCLDCCPEATNMLDWVIIGAESGVHQRPCPTYSVYLMVGHCRAKDVPVFVKQVHNVDGRLIKSPPGWPRQWPLTPTAAY